MFGSFWDFGGGYDDFGPDRRSWRDKSDAAMRREDQAKRLFDAFFETSKSSPVFPITQEIVPPSVHLTDACWKTFKQYVLAKGCTTKRREATLQERIQSKEKRRGKLYVISVTIPVHPDQAQQAAALKKQTAAAAAEKKKQNSKLAAEKKRLEEERKAAQERELQAKIKEEYAAIVSLMDDDGKKVLAPNKPGVLTDASNKSSTDDAVEPSPSKKLKMTKLTVPRDGILQHAELVHQQRVREISSQIYSEKAQERQRLLSELDDKMQAKEAALKQEAREYCDRIKSSITDMASEQQQ